MPQLILLNGAPGCGKSTLARRHAASRPGMFTLDLDLIYDLITGDRPLAGPLARSVALAAARAHLAGGHDVIVPQFLGRPEFIEQLEDLARSVGAEWHHVVVLDPEAYRRFVRRADPDKRVDEHQHAVMTARLREIVDLHAPTVVHSIDEAERLLAQL